jgi:hypothetical protein
MGLWASKYQRVPCKEVTLRDEVWVLIDAAKKRFASLCAEDNIVTDKAADTIAQLVLDIMETSGKETKTIQRPDDMDEAVWRAALKTRERHIQKIVTARLPKYDIVFSRITHQSVNLNVINRNRVSRVIAHIRSVILKEASYGNLRCVIKRPDHISEEDWNECLTTYDETNAVTNAFPNFTLDFDKWYDMVNSKTIKSIRITVRVA